MISRLQTSLQELKNRFRSQTPAQKGVLPSQNPEIFHFTYRSEGERSRIHLRKDPDGSGVLLINANRVLHLNPTAVLMAKLALESTSPDQAVRTLRQTYQISKEQATQDYSQFTATIDELIRPDGACPIHELDLEVTAPFSARPASPYRMDLALTYRCNNDCKHCYNARPRSFGEMPADQWKKVLDRVWELGIPHIVFTGGEPTLRPDLPELIAHAESNGQITGINTNGRRLSDPGYVEQLASAGLDHIQITLESHDPDVHNRMVGSSKAWEQTVAGIRNAVSTRMFVMTNTTMLEDNYQSIPQTLEFLSELGVPTIGLNALIYSGRGSTVGTGLREEELPPLLTHAQEHTAAHGQRLIWYTPTQYCHFDPTQLALGVKGCTAALYNMCIEPDGGVLPCQSYYHPLGNILSDPWDAIWNHELAISIRERKYISAECADCALLSECGGGCPLQPSNPNNGR